MIPTGAYAFAPMLLMAIGAYWADAPAPERMAAQIERETCISLTHSRCWSPRAELKTSRENGIGFGQVTRAYNADGSLRFDKQAELRAAHPELRGWTWAARYDAGYQLAGLVLMDRDLFNRMRPLAAGVDDAWAFALSAYNGGTAGALKDRLLCQNQAACDPQVWFGNVELYSTKSRAKWQGYGQSAYDINRSYVRQVFQRAPEYREAFWQ